MSFQANKIDSELGQRVEAYLKQIGLHTPTVDYVNNVNYMERRNVIEASFRTILTQMGMDLKDDSLIETPLRMAKMYLGETFWGLNPDNFPKVTVVDNKMNYDEMVMERNIQVTSTCEHHLLPIIGFAHVAYIPGKIVPGLSKINRIVEYFSRRPQIQERLIGQIYHSLSHILGTEDIAVMIDAEHMCVKTRGVEDACSDTVTSKLGGVFLKPAVRAEFYSLVAMKKSQS